MPKSNSVMLKPSSQLCPMSCKYCFYKGYRGHAYEPCQAEQAGGQDQFMSLETLEAIVKNAIEVSGTVCSFGFQGGEPCLRGREFFEYAVELQKRYNTRNIIIHNNFQTNGILLDEEWCRFFRQHDFLVGLSLDGPEDIHNANRLLLPNYPGQPEAERGSFAQVMKARELLAEHQVNYNILAVITKASATRGRDVYRFFRKLKEGFIQFIPAMDPGFAQTGKHKFSLGPDDLGIFLQDVFDLWYRDFMRSRSYMYIDLIERFMEKSLLLPPASCASSKSCTVQNIFESDGRHYACDFFVQDELALGSVRKDLTLGEANKGCKDFLKTRIPQECHACEWLELCQVGCKRYRVLRDPAKSPLNWSNRGKSYFCNSYKSFLGESYKRLVEAARTLLDLERLH